ncbi:MAG: hypothetical protein ABIS51_20955 [Sphingomonas sp.]
MESEYYWPTADAVKQLNTLLYLPATGDEQDWEVELSDDRRIHEWLTLFVGNELDLECRSALFLLIMCSIEFADSQFVSSDLLSSARAALGRDERVRARMLSYWKRYFEKTGDESLDRENEEHLRNIRSVLG